MRPFEEQIRVAGVLYSKLTIGKPVSNRRIDLISFRRCELNAEFITNDEFRDVLPEVRK